MIEHIALVFFIVMSGLLFLRNRFANEIIGDLIEALDHYGHKIEGSGAERFRRERKKVQP